MKLEAKTALGIEISGNQINLALLRKRKKGLELQKTASGPVPDGAIKDGNIEDAIVLTKAIKELKTKNKIRARHTALSLVINPMLLQILELPNDAPINVGQFVRDEVKNFAMLSMKRIAVDFCGLKSSDKSSNRRVFVAATDSQKITDFNKVLNEAGLNIDAIEPAVAAYIRACYAKKIAKKYDQNLLFAVVYESTLTLCLFKNEILDFVRTKQLETYEYESDKCFEWIAEEINAVLKFYEHEVRDKCDKWNVTLLTSIRDKFVKEKTELLATKLKEGIPFCDLSQNGNQVELEIRTLEDAYLDTPVAETAHADKPSAIAVGLALKLLNFSSCGLNINLLPPESAEVKSARKHALIIANIAAAVFFLMILSVGFFAIKVKKVNENMRQKQQTQLGRNTHTLLNEQVLLNEQIANTSEDHDGMNTILSAGSFLRWDLILSEIRAAIPKTVRITNFFSDDNSRVLFRGQALSYESIHLFVDILNNSNLIESASLIGTEKDSEFSGLITYSISCSLIK